MPKDTEKQFSYEYLPGTHLLQKLTKPNGMSLTQSYEPQRDLLTGMAYHRGSTLVAQRTYTYDTLGRPLSRSTARNGQTVNDSFGYNTRSELTTATVNGGSYAYDYDNIGNRLSSQSSAGAEADAAVVEYTSNELNQYTALAVDGVVDFQPEYDADGNQTRVKTSTGIWAISYDTENRPTDFTSMAADNTITTVHCEYDSMGRRAIKRVMVNGNVTLHQRYIYRGYLQIACIDLTRSHHPALWYITWDPTQNIATRPLAIQKDGTWYTYGWDLTKNICEVFGPAGYLRTAYTYTPYGQVTANGDVEQPIQWSSEFNDTEIGLIYYNYRHYNPTDGRWIGMDKLGIKAGLNQYWYVANITCHSSDYLGLSNYVDTPGFPFTPSPDKGSGAHKSLKATNEDIEFYKALKRCALLAHVVYPLASEHLRHYLSNSGNPRSFDLKTFIKSKGLQQAIHNELISLKQFAKTAKTGTYSVRSTSSIAGYFKQKDDENPFFAIGGFQLWGNGRLEVCQNGTFQASLTLSFFDRYNWNDFDGVEKLFLALRQKCYNS